MNEIEVNSKPLRAQGGMGLLSRSISVQKSQQSIPIFPRGEREEERKRRRAPGGGAACCSLGKGRARERKREGVSNPNNSQPLKTKLPLDSIRH